MNNRLCKNRKSPSNEEMIIARYKELNPSSKKVDGLDIAAVVAMDGTPGHGLLSEKYNRSHDNKYHVVKDFIPDSKLKAK